MLVKLMFRPVSPYVAMAGITSNNTSVLQLGIVNVACKHTVHS